MGIYSPNVVSPATAAGRLDNAVEERCRPLGQLYTANHGLPDYHARTVKGLPNVERGATG